MRLFVSPEVVRPGTLVVVAVVNDGDDLAHYGLRGSFERWDGVAWAPGGPFVATPSRWAEAGAFHTDRAKAIGIGTPAGAAGPVLWLEADVAPGRYRLTIGGASGEVEVDEGVAFVAPVVFPGSAPHLDVAPELLRPEGTELLVRASSRYGRGPDPPDLQRSSRGPVVIERAHEGWWHPVTDLPAVDADGESTVRLPPLEPGSYRLTRETVAGPLSGYVWVVA